MSKKEKEIIAVRGSLLIVPSNGEWISDEPKISISDPSHISFLKALQQELGSQDNRMTNDPIFEVRYHDKIYGIADGWQEGFVYVRHDDHEVFFESDDIQGIIDWHKEENLAKGQRIEAIIVARGNDIDMGPWGWNVVNYKSITKTYQSGFFTAKAAQACIDRKKHDIPGEPFVYASSGVWDSEWGMLRKIFMEMKID